MTITTITTSPTRPSEMRRLAMILERTALGVRRSDAPVTGSADGMRTRRTLIAGGDVLHWNNGGGDVRVDLSLKTVSLMLSFRTPTKGSLDRSPIHAIPNDDQDPRIPLIRMLEESARVVRATLDPATTIRNEPDGHEHAVLRRLRCIGAAMQDVDPSVRLDKGLTVTAPGPVNGLTVQGVGPDATGGLDWRDVAPPPDSDHWWRGMPAAIAVLDVDPPAPRDRKARATFDRDAWTVAIGPASIEWHGEEDPVVLMRMLSELRA